MKTIEITSGDQKAQFTTKSVTLDGKEFFYAQMSNVIHSTEKHVYSFTYNGEIKFLPYEEKDAKTLNAIFSQVQKLTAQKRGAAPQPALESAAPQRPTAAPETPAPPNTDVPSEKTAASKQDTVTAAPVRVTDVMNGSVKDPSGNAIASKEGKPEDAKGTAKTKDTDETPEVDAEQKARRKKSLTVFAIILGAVLVLSVIYYFVVGTPSAPAPINPNGSESQQYDDIDQLIDDLQ